MKAVSRLAVLSFTSVFFLTSPAYAGGLIFLSDSAAARMTNDDFTAMTKAAVEALNDEAVPSTKVWTNPKTGSGGTVKTVKTFTSAGGEPCKLVEHNTQAKKLTHEGSSTLCKMKDGWKLTSGEANKATTPK